ncbi:glycosyltransferase 87 family protein [Terrabacter lapilli]|uniref:Glycosyltransferase 87 family protein n=2 Tax=Terrabacter lapilli TaxID=436231 RepID=A0ABP5E700_9MICO
MLSSTARRPATLLAPLAIIATAALAWLQWKGVTRGIWVDSDVYVMGAKTLMYGGDLYADSTAVDLRFTYSPFAAAVFVPLALLPAAVARWTLTALSLVALVTSIVVVGRQLRLQPWVMIWLGVAAAALEPVLRNLLLGQINLILMALVIVDLLVVPRRYRGLLVGVAAGIKLTPAVFVIYFLLKRDWPSVARTTGSFALTVLIGSALSWSSSVSFWLGGFLGLGKFGAGAVVGTDNQSLLAAVLRVLGRPEVPLAAQAVLAICGVGLGTLAARRSLRRGGSSAQVEAVAWIALGGLLGSPVSWTHHWVWVIVVLAVLASRREPFMAAVVMALFWLPIVWMLYTGLNYQSLTFPWWKGLLSATYVLTGAALLVVAASSSERCRPTSPDQRKTQAPQSGPPPYVEACPDKQGELL